MAIGNLIQPYIYNNTLAAGSSHTDVDNIIVFPGVAHFIQIQNFDSEEIKVYLNDCVTGFTIPGNSSQSFNSGDLTISKIAYSNAISGSTSSYCETIIGVMA